MTVETSRLDIGSIQMTRAVAAVMVVLVHIDYEIAGFGLAPFGFGWGARGVDVFFLISGFIMWVSAERRPDMTAGAFITRRVRRIVPLYWAITGFVVAVALAAPALVHTTRLDAWHTAASLLFLPAIHPATGKFWPVVVPGWSLNYEMLFYILFAVAIGCAKGAPHIRLALSAALILGFGALAAIASPLLPALRFYNPVLLVEFLCGILLGALYLTRKAPSGPLWYAGLIVGFALLWRFWESDWAALAGAVLVVSAALFAPLPTVGPLVRLGDASYSLYLTQVLTLPFASLVYKAAGLAAAPRAAFAAFALAIAVAGALACYHLVERPADRLVGAVLRLKAARAT